MLEGHETSGRDEVGVGWGQRLTAEVGLPAFEGLEARDGRPEARPSIGLSQHQTGTARSQDPFMGAGDEEIRAQRGRVDVLDAKTVHAVDDQDGPLRRRPTGVDGANRRGHLGDRQLETGRRVDPGQPDRTGGGRDRAPQANHHSFGAGLGGAVMERHLAHRRTLLGGRQRDRLVMGIVVMLGRQDLVPRVQAESVVDQRQARGRIRHPRQLGRGGSGVGGEPVFDPPPVVAEEEQSLLDAQRVGIDSAAPAVDGFPHRPRMGRQEEARHRNQVRVEVEKAPHGAPIDGPPRIEQWRAGGSFCGA